MSSHMGKMSMIKVKKEGSTLYYTSPKTFAEAVEILFTLTLKVIFDGNGRDYTLKNKKRTQWVLRIVYLLTFILGVLGILLITNPVLITEL